MTQNILALLSVFVAAPQVFANPLGMSFSGDLRNGGLAREPAAIVTKKKLSEQIESVSRQVGDVETQIKSLSVMAAAAGDTLTFSGQNAGPTSDHGFFNFVTVNGVAQNASNSGENYVVPAGFNLLLTDIRVTCPGLRTLSSTSYHSFDIRFTPQAGAAFGVAYVTHFRTDGFSENLSTGILIPEGKNPFFYVDCSSNRTAMVSAHGHLVKK